MQTYTHVQTVHVGYVYNLIIVCHHRMVHLINAHTQLLMTQMGSNISSDS